MPDQRWIEEAEKVVAKFSRFEGSIEWVSNPNPDKLRAAVAQALQEAFRAGMVEIVKEAPDETD